MRKLIKPEQPARMTNHVPDGTFAELLDAHDQARASGRPLLTRAGICYVRKWLVRVAPAQQRRGFVDMKCRAALAHCPLPSWDAESRCLWLGPGLLKQFRQPAPNQTRVLDVFEEHGWLESHIDDPLSPEPGETEEDVQRRLHETVKNLNRTLPAGTIRFHGDGTGQGIRWEYHHPQARGDGDAATR